MVVEVAVVVVVVVVVALVVVVTAYEGGPALIILRVGKLGQTFFIVV